MSFVKVKINYEKGWDHTRVRSKINVRYAFVTCLRIDLSINDQLIDK